MHGYISSWYRIVYCCKWASHTAEQVEKLDKFACINFTAWTFFCHFRLKLISLSGSLFLSRIDFERECAARAECTFQISVCFSLFPSLCSLFWRCSFSRVYPHHVCKMCKHWMYRGIDAMHTKSVCSIIVSIYLFAFIRHDVQSICHHSSGVPWLGIMMRPMQAENGSIQHLRNHD